MSEALCGGSSTLLGYLWVVFGVPNLYHNTRNFFLLGQVQISNVQCAGICCASRLLLSQSAHVVPSCIEVNPLQLC